MNTVLTGVTGKPTIRLMLCLISSLVAVVAMKCAVSSGHCVCVIVVQPTNVC